MDAGTMTPGDAFRRARAVLLEHREDPERARAEFRWPVLDRFNWVDDWFDTCAPANPHPGLVVVRDDRTETISFGELSDRSRRVARYFHDAGARPGDRVLVMLSNVAPLWETMLAAIRQGLVVIPATAQLTADDLED